MTENPRPGWNLSPQVIFGIAIVFFGLLLTAGNLGIGTNFTRAIRFWPMVFTAVGLAMALDRDSSGPRRTFGLVLIVGGVWQTANTAFGLGFYIDEWWPLVLVALGVLLVWRSLKGSSDSGTSSSSTGAFGAAAGSGTTTGDGRREDTVTSFALMSGVKRNIVSPGFRRANLTAIMGGVEFDLRQCAATGGESVIDVFAMWGGIVIRVPPDWHVASEVVPLMGGVEDSSGHGQPSKHRLVIKGMAIMGGVEVKS